MLDLPESAEAGIPEYMVSYADMLTIMLAFFVVLYSTTSASGTKDKGGKSGEVAQGGKEPAAAPGDSGREIGTDGGLNVSTEERLKKVFDSLYYRFGPEWTATNCWAGGPRALRAGLGKPSDSGSCRPGRGAPDDYSMMIAPRAGDNIVTGGRVYFDGLTATLNPKQVHQLQQLAAELAGKMQKIEVRGHTSRRPLPANSPIGDHWDLAYARAKSVEKCLVAQGIAPERIRLGVASYNEPLVSDPTMLKTDQDARVEVRLLNEWVSARPGTGTPRAAKNVSRASTQSPP